MSLEISTETTFLLDMVNETLGPELLTNNDFANWTGDDPDDWDIVGVEDAGSYVTENPAGNCQIVSDGDNIGIGQSALTIGKNYNLTIDVTASASGSLKIGTALNSSLFTSGVGGVGSYSFVAIADDPVLRITRAAACDITIDNVSVKEIL